MGYTQGGGARGWEECVLHSDDSLAGKVVCGTRGGRRLRRSKQQNIRVLIALLKC